MRGFLVAHKNINGTRDLLKASQKSERIKIYRFPDHHTLYSPTYMCVSSMRKESPFSPPPPLLLKVALLDFFIPLLHSRLFPQKSSERGGLRKVFM